MSNFSDPIATTEVAGVPNTKMPSILRILASMYRAVSMIDFVLSIYPSRPWKSKQAQVQAIVAPARLPQTLGLLWDSKLNETAV